MEKKILRRKISLKRKPEKIEKTSDVSYPSLYLYDLPLNAENVGKKYSANITLKLTSVTKRTGSKTSFDFEVIDIKFK